jgi:hypothetical protein
VIERTVKDDDEWYNEKWGKENYKGRATENKKEI